MLDMTVVQKMEEIITLSKRNLLDLFLASEKNYTENVAVQLRS